MHRRSILFVERKSVSENFSNVSVFCGGVFPELNNGLQRVGHTILVYKKDLYLYGGYGPKNTYSNFIYCNVKMTLQWREIRGVGVVPCGRANHSAILFENKMIVYGGHRNLEVFDDLYAVNLDTMRWEKINYDKGQGPGPLFSHAAVYVPPTQSMIIIGGFHQREHNVYLAHSFDIRHSVWNGIRGPSSVSPMHLQLCSAAYHAHSTSLIVIGLVESDALTASGCDVPYIYMMNVHSGAWVKVKTTVAPENANLLRAPAVWEYFLREFFTMGGIYDTERNEWYFPILLGLVETIISWRRLDNVSTTPTFAKNRSFSKTDSYGFFKLQMRDMVWSIVHTKFPKRVFTEILARDASRATTQRDHRSGSGRGRDRTLLDKKPTPQLYSSAGVSRFQRKYAYALIDFSGQRKQRIKQKIIIMHGGVTFDDYAALLFSPVMERQQFGSINSLEAAQLSSEIGTVFFDQHGTKLAEQASQWWDTKEDDSFSYEESEFSRLVLESKQEPASLAATNVVTDVNLMAGRQHRLNSDPSVLPLLPGSRISKNMHRFALLYHARSAVHGDKVLPEITCPVAVINSEEDRKAWGANYYSKMREWLSIALAYERDEEKAYRRNQRKLSSSRSKTVSSDDESSTSDYVESKAPLEGKSTRNPVPTKVINQSSKPRDFFLEKNLEVFDLKEFENINSLQSNDLSLILSEEGSISRLHMKVKRNKEVQRLPQSVFQRMSVGNVTDLGGAVAYQLMVDSLTRLDASQESRRQRALIRWRYLRVMVFNGEASFIMHRVREQEGAKSAYGFSSSKSLMLGPELRFRNTDCEMVPCRPIPYSLSACRTSGICSFEITPSGYVMYHPINNVK